MRTSKTVYAVGLFAVGIASIVVAVLSAGQPKEQKRDLYPWVREFFEKRFENTIKYDMQFMDLCEKRPSELVRALLEYYVKEVKDELPGFRFEFALPMICFSGVNGHRMRPELVKYLKLDEDGNLETKYEGRKTLALIAYELLFLIDKFDLEVSWRALVIDRSDPVTKMRLTYEPVIAKFDKDIPPALVEYLYSEWGDRAWHAFHEVASKDEVVARQFSWSAHLIQTTAWRIEQGHKHRAELTETMEEVRRLASDRAWYTRRYVVHVLLKYPFFRTPELVKKLQNDPHPLVRERAKHIKLDPTQQK